LPATKAYPPKSYNENYAYITYFCLLPADYKPSKWGGIKGHAT